MPQMDPELLVLGRLMRSMEAVPGEERRVRICRFLMSRCSETWPIDMKPPGPPWDQLTLFIPTPEPPQRWTHPEGGEITVRSVAGGLVTATAPEQPAPTVPTAAPEPAVPAPPPPPAQPPAPAVQEPAWTPAPTVTEAAPQAPAPAVPPPAGYPVPPPGTGQPDAGLDGMG